MDPIINPWLIYLAELANWVKLAGFMAAGIVLLGASIEYMDAEQERVATRVLRRDLPTDAPYKLKFKISLAFLILWIVVPSTDTVYKMIAAHYITPDAVDNLGHVFRSILKAIKEVR